jgi:hypothetical protein
MVKCMRRRMLLPESRMHKLIRFHEITPGAEFNQMQIEFKYYVRHNIGCKTQHWKKIHGLHV